MKRMVILLIAALLAGTTTTAAVLQHQQRIMSEKMVRLHVVANSDSEADQNLKLEVRDAVISVTEEACSKGELVNKLTQIEDAARECLKQNNSDYSVSVTLQKENFPTRMYDTFSLPAGAYTSLRVTIGEGAGHNWWCVAFPSICFCAAADFDEAAASAGFTDSELKLITEENEAYVLKFKTLEILQDLKQMLIKDKKASD